MQQKVRSAVTSAMQRNNESRFKVMVVDPLPMILLGIQMLVEGHPELELVGVARNAAQGLATAMETRPDVVVTELSLPDMHGSDFVQSLRQLPFSPRVLVFSDKAPTTNVSNIARAGATGYISKDCDLDTIVTTITLVANGFVCLPDHQKSDAAVRLSGREAQVIEALLKGATNRAVSQQLGINEKTVSHYKCMALKKLNVPSIAILAGMGIQPW